MAKINNLAIPGVCVCVCGGGGGVRTPCGGGVRTPLDPRMHSHNYHQIMKHQVADLPLDC